MNIGDRVNLNYFLPNFENEPNNRELLGTITRNFGKGIVTVLWDNGAQSPYYLNQLVLVERGDNSRYEEIFL